MKSLFLGLVGLLAIVALPTSSAHAQATRTWVSGVGDDVNPCSRTAPCKTFAGAISKTAAGGEINCIDPGAYGAVTITKSILIDCEAQLGGVLHSATNGIIINAGATDKVMLRNIDINGSPPSSPGLNGIRYLAGGEVNVENVKIHGSTAADPNGAGIVVNTSTFGILTVRNTTFYNARYGIKLAATSGNIVASITDSKFNGIAVNGVDAGTNTYVVVSNSVFSTNNGTAILAGTSSSTVYAKGNLITNSGVGISANVAGAKINAIGNVLFGNTKAFNAAAGATFLSAGDNRFDINPGSAATGTLGSK
jgi:parallel beta helix pectate lyase-like protein